MLRMLFIFLWMAYSNHLSTEKMVNHPALKIRGLCSTKDCTGHESNTIDSFSG